VKNDGQGNQDKNQRTEIQPKIAAPKLAELEFSNKASLRGAVLKEIVRYSAKLAALVFRVFNIWPQCINLSKKQLSINALTILKQCEESQQ